MENKAPDAFRTISEVADELDLPQHVLRFWETRFREIKPMKRGGGRRYYRPDDVDILRGIRHLLYGEGYTIRGVQRILREQGGKFVQQVWQAGAPQPPHSAAEDAEFTEAAPAVAEASERPGEGGFLGRLIGRDLGDRRDDAAERREPPLQSAPVPRIEPSDRARHAPAEPETMPPAAAERAAPAVHRGLGREEIRKLQAVLHDLGECRTLLDAALGKS